MVSIPVIVQFKKFACETKLHGIRRTFEGKRFANLFWAALVVISFIMAGRDLINLVNRYQSSPTAIQISLSNRTFKATTPTLCMEFLATYSNFTSNYDTLEMRAESAILWDSPDLGLSAQEFDQFYDLADSANYTSVDYSTGRNTSTYTPNVLYYTYMMLSYLGELEQKLMGGDETDLKEYQFNLGYNDMLVTERVQTFYQFYKRRSPAVTLKKLTKVFGMWFCLQQLRGMSTLTEFSPEYPGIYGQFENYRYFGDPHYINLPICRANTITFLGFSLVCSKLFETPTVPVVADYNYFAIYNTLRTRPPDFSSRISSRESRFLAAMIPNFKWHLDIDGRNVLPPASDRTNVFSWNPGEHVVVDISVATEYQYRNRPTSPCSTAEANQLECRRQRRAEFVYQQCGCWPSLVQPSTIPDVVNCSDFNFLDLNLPTAKIYSLTVDLLPCGANLSQVDLSKCLSDCEIIEKKMTQQVTKKMLWNRSWSSTISPSPYKPGSIEFRYTADPHLLIVETSQVEWSSFVATWGGSLGTWLGASLLALAHIPVFFLRPGQLG